MLIRSISFIISHAMIEHILAKHTRILLELVTLKCSLINGFVSALSFSSIILFWYIFHSFCHSINFPSSRILFRIVRKKNQAFGRFTIDLTFSRRFRWFPQKHINWKWRKTRFFFSPLNSTAVFWIAIESFPSIPSQCRPLFYGKWHFALTKYMVSWCHIDCSTLVQHVQCAPSLSANNSN